MVGRFALTIYIAQYLSLTDLGLFGLIVGVAGMMPSISGMGLNYFLARELVDKDDYAAGVLIKDRLVVTVSMMAAISVVALATIGSMFPVYLGVAVLVVPIVFTETVAFDLHLCFISLRRPILANSLLFVRSAAWVFPLIGLGLVHAASRTLTVVLSFWLAGNVLFFLAVVVAFRNWPIDQILQARINWADAKATVRRARLIYLNDIGFAGMVYLDRYIVSHFLGLKQTGVYTLYWSFSNAIQVLVTSAVVQVSVPRLVSIVRSGVGSWGAAIRKEIAKSVSLAIVLGVLAFLIGVHVLPLVGFSKLTIAPPLFALMLSGVVVKIAADMLNSGLYARGMDNQLAVINSLGLVVAIVSSVICLTTFGLLGAGVSMIITPTCLAAARGLALHRVGAFRT